MRALKPERYFYLPPASATPMTALGEISRDRVRRKDGGLFWGWGGVGGHNTVPQGGQLSIILLSLCFVLHSPHSSIPLPLILCIFVAHIAGEYRVEEKRVGIVTFYPLFFPGKNKGSK